MMFTPSKTNVLHITNWYPSEDNPLDGIWIKKQIESLSNRVNSDVYQITVEPGRKLKTMRTTIPGIRLQIPGGSWFVIEVITSLLLLWLLMFKIRLRHYEVINFHIAYPLCVFLKIFRAFIRQPIVINEHWSAYHYNFGVKDPGRLGRAREIFTTDLTLITVSKALANDISKFSAKQNLKFHVVPNVVDTNVFKYKSGTPEAFLMASHWKTPKDPIAVLKAIEMLRERHLNIQLRIAGSGPLLESILEYIQEHQLQDHMICLGRLDQSDLAFEMQSALAFVHISNYETFSVVCAESICCGTPVIASAVGGIPEFVGIENGILVKNESSKELTDAMESVIINNHFDRPSIARRGALLFEKQRVGQLYCNAINSSLEIN